MVTGRGTPKGEAEGISAARPIKNPAKKQGERKKQRKREKSTFVVDRGVFRAQKDGEIRSSITAGVQVRNRTGTPNDKGRKNWGEVDQNTRLDPIPLRIKKGKEEKARLKTYASTLSR